jgi:uncharacterized membrane protein YphA (DoxX/SURF4 family)
MTVYTIFGIVALGAFILALIRFIVNRPPNILITFLQDFVGVFFIFSGFVKAVDPLGTSYKMHEYFEAFSVEGLRPMWEYIATFSTFFAIVMIAAELFVGLMLIIGWKPRFTVGIIWLLTLFFTFLTGFTYLSGYGITKPFILISGAAILLFAAVAFPEKQSRRINITFFAFGMAVILFLITKLTGHFFTSEFTESKMQVTDCGCFGDFIKLKPWETFYKDIILDLMILMLVLNVKFVRPVFGNMFRSGVAGFGALASLLFCLYNIYSNEPVIDFRPYKIGNDINDLRKEKKPEVRQIEWECHNKITGKWETLSYDDVTKKGMQVQCEKFDTNCRKDIILDPGIPAKITNLRIEDGDGNDITDTLLADPGYSCMVVVYNLNITHAEAFKQLNAIAAGMDKLGLKFYVVAVNNGKVDEFRHQYQTAYTFYNADETPLKTIIRSNPGLVLFKHGVVINKWHYRHLPTFGELNQEYFSKK